MAFTDPFIKNLKTTKTMQDFREKKARFFNVLDLVNQLEQEKLDNRGGRLAEHMAKHGLVVLDELGYLPFSKNGGQLLFHLISKLYERTSLIITTNLTFGEWPQVFGETFDNKFHAHSFRSCGYSFCMLRRYAQCHNITGPLLSESPRHYNCAFISTIIIIHFKWILNEAGTQPTFS